MIEHLLGHLFGEMINPPDPSQLTVDENDPESILFAASILDQHGEWNNAILLYEYVLDKWPDEHGKYAQNSIAEVTKKIEMAR